MQKDSRLSAVVVLPTYNEAGNIGKMLDVLFRDIFPKISGWNMNVVVVDDSSPDGTGAIVEEKKKTYQGIHLLTEPEKSGLGTAYMKGFDYAMKNLHADVVMEFDADFQHPPETIPLLIQKIDEGYDYVLGSRKIPGGSDAAGRGIIRRALTSCGGFAARFILFFPGKNFSHITDPTTGLKATRVRGVADRLNLNPEHFYSRKFGYRFQLLYETVALGAKYAEIPLAFQERKADKSKIKFSTAFEILMVCMKTRLSG